MAGFDKQERQHLIIIGRACIKRMDRQKLVRLISRHIVSVFDRRLFGIDCDPLEVKEAPKLSSKEIRSLDTRRCLLAGLAVIRELARPGGEIQLDDLRAILGDSEKQLEWASSVSLAGSK